MIPAFFCHISKKFSHFFVVSSFPATQSKFPADWWNDDRKCISSPTVAPNSKVLPHYIVYCSCLTGESISRSIKLMTPHISAW
jgi:hypothetical protein